MTDAISQSTGAYDEKHHTSDSSEPVLVVMNNTYIAWLDGTVFGEPYVCECVCVCVCVCVLSLIHI